MIRAMVIQSAIRTVLIQQGPCALQALLDRLPQFSWSEVFAVIDRLSRDGYLVLRHPTRFDYEVSVGQTWPTVEQSIEQADAEDDAVGRADVGSQAYEEVIPA